MNITKYQLNIEAITPERAQSFLDCCPRNRTPSPSRIESYAKIISEGNWGPCSMIIYDEDGNLVDGGHRLRAIIKSGCSASMIVFRGLEKKFIPFIDTGRPRSAGDMLSFVEGFEGLTNLRNIAAMTRCILHLKSNEINSIIANDKLANFILDNNDMIRTAYNDYSRVRPVGGTIAVAAAAYLIRTSEGVKKENADKYFEQIALGENICIGMPAYAVRCALFNSGKARGAGSMRQIRDVYIILRGWHSYINGESLKSIKPANANMKSIAEIKLSRSNSYVQEDIYVQQNV